MQIAIVGLAASGKTTVFNTLTRGHAQTGGFGGLQLNVGAVKVPDERLDRLAEIFKPKKVIQADVTYVDLPAPPASSEGRIGTEELPAEHLRRLREALQAGRPIRDVELDVDEEKSIRGFRFLTQKPVLVLLNLGEADLPYAAERVGAIADRYDHRHTIVDALSARIEMELGELEPDEAAAFM